MQLAQERRRNGAFEWGLFEDAAQAGRFVETFLLDSWMEHLRQHERVTQADRARQETVSRFQTEGVAEGDAPDRGGPRHRVSGSLLGQPPPPAAAAASA